MEKIKEKLINVISLMGFKENQINLKIDEEHKKISIIIDDEIIRSDKTPNIMSAFNLLINQILKKEKKDHFIVDLNYYRKERERLIIQLAKAAAKKAIINNKEVELPPMNSYERRIIHEELSTHPDLTTESMGDHKNRRVVIKHIN